LRTDSQNLETNNQSFHNYLVNGVAVSFRDKGEIRHKPVFLIDFENIKKNVSIDWTIRESVQAHLRVLVKKILRKYGYPPDKQKMATETVLKQAEVIAKDWTKDFEII